ncbi:MAG: tetratricopeptide repeat protein [FCB group bacterium]|nr:tetratricopeptide repeat protein [FCB group bacterium]
MCYSVKMVERKRLGVIFFLLCTGMLFANDPGWNAFYKGDYEKARNYYRERQKKEKNNEKLAYNLGTAALALQDAQEAASFLTESLAGDNPDQRAKAHYNLGQLALQEQDMEAAATHFKKSMLYDPDDRNSKIMYEYLLRMKQEEEQQQAEEGEGNNEQQDGQDGGCDTQGEKGQQKETDANDDQSPGEENADNSEMQSDPADSQLREQDLTPQELSKEQARNILNAMREQEMESMKKLILSKNRGGNIKRGNKW